jgi:hypothetical protein
MPPPTQTDTNAQTQQLLSQLSAQLTQLRQITEILMSSKFGPGAAGAEPPTEHRPSQFAASPAVARLFLENPIQPPEPQTVSRGKTMAIESPPQPAPQEIATAIGDELAALSANYLRRAQAAGEGTAVIARDGRFVPTFAADLLERLPIDPYRSSDALERLHSDLTSFIDVTGGHFPWGRLQRLPDGSITVTPTDTHAA